MSLFIMILKGEYDQMLSWPFTHKVSVVTNASEHAGIAWVG